MRNVQALIALARCLGGEQVNAACVTVLAHDMTRIRRLRRMLETSTAPKPELTRIPPLDVLLRSEGAIESSCAAAVGVRLARRRQSRNPSRTHAVGAGIHLVNRVPQSCPSERRTARLPDFKAGEFLTFNRTRP